MHRPPAHAPALLAENRRRYELLVDCAELHSDRGDLERTLRAATLAANFAWMAPVGLLTDVRLERAVVSVARGGGRATVDGGRATGRVLHVMSEAYALGGHTRLVGRWVERDDRRADVALTHQRGALPDALRTVVGTAGGRLHDLAAGSAPLADRARALRALMADVDLVVLHVHPYDAVALAAATMPGPRPPVVFENHADLSFWLGLGAADVVCDLRPEARELGVGQRAVQTERVQVLPMPLQTATTPPEAGAELRRQLGIAADRVVCLTVSDDWKVAPSWGRGMHHVVDHALRWAPSVTYVLVGVGRTPDWDKVARRHPGRVVLPGKVLDTGPYYAMADLYLDSYPTRSGTTPLEAGLHGVPVVGITDLPVGDPVRLFQLSSPGLAPAPVAGSPEQLATLVRRLAADPAARAEAGSVLRDSVVRAHDGDGWHAAMERLYTAARLQRAVDVDELGESVTDDRYGALLLAAWFPGGTESPPPDLLAGPLGDLFDMPMRADLFALTHRDGGAPLQVRIADGWAAEPAGTSRLLDLAARHTHLALSFPFLPDDDAAGTATGAELGRLLAGLGQDAETCGDICVESTRSRTTGPTLTGELVPTASDLDRLEPLVTSPCWHAARHPVGVGS